MKEFFAVAIDGIPDVHNQIRKNPVTIEKTVETVNFLKSKGIGVNVNTVI